MKETEKNKDFKLEELFPIGYVRHPEIENAIAVDSETKWIVEKIFDLAVNGAGVAKITKILTAEKVPTA